jgi:hypothetical protein
MTFFVIGQQSENPFLNCHHQIIWPMQHQGQDIL